jgi:hypothetical protein
MNGLGGWKIGSEVGRRGSATVKTQELNRSDERNRAPNPKCG